MRELQANFHRWFTLFGGSFYCSRLLRNISGDTRGHNDLQAKSKRKGGFVNIIESLSIV